MIELISIGGQSTPKIFCDSCGKEISNVKEAAIVFPNFMPDDKRISVVYVHKDFVKGDCMTKAEEIIRSKGEQPGWIELGEHLAFLVSNVGMTPSDIEKKLS